MKSMRCLKLFAWVVLVAIHSNAGAQQTPEELTIEALGTNTKISKLGEDMLAPYRNGEATISVVISLAETAAATALSARSASENGMDISANGASASSSGPYYNLSNANIRTGLASTVKTELDNFIAGLDSFNGATVSVNSGSSVAPITVTNQFKYSFGFAADVTPEGLAYILQSDKVVLVEENLVLTPQMTQGIAVMNGTTTRGTYRGAGMAVAIVDTGIDDSHPDLNGGKVLGGYDFGDDDSNFRPTSTGSAHGTSVGGIVAGDVNNVGDYIGGVAPDAKLYGLKISPGDSGSASSADMVDAWEWVITHQNDDPNNPILIVNTSFGGGRYTSSCDSTNSSMTQAALNGVNAGITHFVSSGNDGFCDAMGWPACITHVNSIGAVYDANIGTPGWCVSTSSCLASSPNPGCSAGTEAFFETSTAADKVTAYSNSDTNLTMFAPSNNAYTTDIVGSGGSSSGDYTTSFGGTSAAAPYSAGAAAILQSAAKDKLGRFLTPAEVRSYLVSTGQSVTDSKVALTKPRVDIAAAVQALPQVDLITENPAVTNAAPVEGESFTVSATVTNAGGGTSAATTLRYYQSLNSFISTADTPIGTDAVGALAGGASSPESRSVSIATAGRYWLGACVDAVAGESPDNNQCSSGVQVDVAQSVPDLIVEMPSVDNVTPAPGQNFTVGATVRNQGNGTSAATTLRYFRSANSIISINDTEIATDSVASLAGGATSVLSASVSWPNTGRSYIGACVTAVAGELPTNNQCSDGVQIDIANSSDLSITSHSTNNSTPDLGQTVQLGATIQNAGNSASPASTVRYYRSDDSTITTSDTEIASSALAGIAGGGATASASASVSFVTPGTFYVGSCVDSVAGETNTSNQCVNSGILTTVVGPDMFEPDNSSGAANAINNNVTQTHTIHVGGDEDWVTFVADDDLTDVVIETAGASGDTTLTLYNGSVTQIDFDDDGGEGLFSKIEAASLAEGTYFVRAAAFSAGVKIESYTIKLSYAGDDDVVLLSLPGILAAVKRRAGKSCGTDMVRDCASKCVDATAVASRIGDRSCDDGQADMDLTCSTHDNDGGDCD